MEKIKKNLGLIIFVIIVIIIGIWALTFRSDNEDYYQFNDDITIKHYEANEYIPVNISYDQMARIYLQDYVSKLINKPKEAYELLDMAYSKNKFKTYEDFLDYKDNIMSKKTREMSVSKYAISDYSTYRDFDIYDANGNLFIIRETGVLQYKVYFDRYTVSMNS